MSLKKILSASLLGAALFSQVALADVYELRTYTTLDGRLDALLSRFEDHTMRIFDKHNMNNIAYWVPQDIDNTLIYIISHADREAAAANWGAFIGDPEWQEVAENSQLDGQIVSGVESVFMDATSWSPLK